MDKSKLLIEKLTKCWWRD